MPSNKPRLATYTNDKTVYKFNYISNFEKRSTSKQLEYIVEEYIRQFELKYGEIKIEV